MTAAHHVGAQNGSNCLWHKHKASKETHFILPGSELGLYGSSKKTGWTDKIGSEIGYKKSGQMRSCWHTKIATHFLRYTVGVP